MILFLLRLTLHLDYAWLIDTSKHDLVKVPPLSSLERGSRHACCCRHGCGGWGQVEALARPRRPRLEFTRSGWVGPRRALRWHGRSGNDGGTCSLAWPRQRLLSHSGSGDPCSHVRTHAGGCWLLLLLVSMGPSAALLLAHVAVGATLMIVQRASAAAAASSGEHAAAFVSKRTRTASE